MKVYVGKFRYIYDGETECVVATTECRVEQELVKLAQQYVEFLDEDEKSELDESCNTFKTWQELGWDNEWFSLDYQLCEVHSEGHILKYAMETI
jgi:hypothetical protein